MSLHLLEAAVYCWGTCASHTYASDAMSAAPALLLLLQLLLMLVLMFCCMLTLSQHLTLAHD